MRKEKKVYRFLGNRQQMLIKGAERVHLSALPSSHLVGARVTPQCCSILQPDILIVARPFRSNSVELSR